MTGDRDSHLSLHERVYQRLRWLILSGAWARGTKMPASRTLAGQMAVSRNTVLSALDRLLADNWVEARRGSGIYVTYCGPQYREPQERAHAEPRSAPLSPRAHAVDLFPSKVWDRLQSRRWKHISGAGLGLGDPFGWLPLREAIAAHVSITRGVECGPDNVIITTSAPAAIDLAIRALNLSGSEAWIEDPGYNAFRQSLRNSGVRPIPVRVDQLGLDISHGVSAAPEARLAIVTPTCQFPTCVVMADERRAQLVAWARENRAWIIDDDYDWQSTDWPRSTRPLAARDKYRAIYVNSFNPLLFPSLRIAFAVVPPPLVDRFSAVQMDLDDQANVPNQMVLADFMSGGHFDAHLKRLAAAYPERRATLLRCIEEELSGVLRARKLEIGTQVVATLTRHREQEFVDLCAGKGIVVRQMANFRQLAPRAEEVLFGFAGFVPAAIMAAVKTIRQAIG